MGITFRTQLGKPGKQGRKVYVRCSYKRHSRDFPTAMYLKPNELTKGGKIKNALVANRCADIINEYRQRAYNLRLETSGLEPARVFELIEGGTTTDGALSFTDFANRWLEKSTRRGNANYRTALRALHSFMKKDNLTASDITARNLTAFAESMRGKPRAQSLYLSAVAKVFNDMREYYYNEERGESLIRHDLRRLRLPKQGAAAGGKRALTLTDARRLLSLSLGLDAIKNLDKSGGNTVKNLDKLRIGDEVELLARADDWTTEAGEFVEPAGQLSGLPQLSGLQQLPQLSGRARLAVDCWALSFCMMGINSVDLYELRAADFNGDTVTYNRHKTRERRADGARMVVAVPHCLRPLLAKYRGEGGALLCFSRRYGSYRDFQRALNIGLKEAGELLGVGGLTFYSARHSFASLAVNVAGVDKYTCGEMLCHVDSATRVTDTYITKDWRRIHLAAARVLAAVGLR